MLTQLFELSWKDSNPHRRNQNPTCYHYTTRQFVSWCVCFTGAKLRTFFESASVFAIFFCLKMIFFVKGRLRKI